jgi:hypothetical protein
MGDEARLTALVGYSIKNDRICPQPGKWDTLWRLLGRTGQQPPLVQSGWAYSPDRQKRAHVLEQLKYALASGLLDRTDEFVRQLEPSDWHTSPADHLDWSYRDALGLDESRRQLTVTKAAEIIRPAQRMDRGALGSATIAETLFLCSLIFGEQGVSARLEALKQEQSRFPALINDEECAPLEGTNDAVSLELRNIGRAKSTECVLLKLLSCLHEPRLHADRDAVYDLIEDVSTLLSLS